MRPGLLAFAAGTHRLHRLSHPGHSVTSRSTMWPRPTSPLRGLVWNMMHSPHHGTRGTASRRTPCPARVPFLPTASPLLPHPLQPGVTTRCSPPSRPPPPPPATTAPSHAMRPRRAATHAVQLLTDTLLRALQHSRCAQARRPSNRVHPRRVKKGAPTPPHLDAQPRYFAPFKQEGQSPGAHLDAQPL